MPSYHVYILATRSGVLYIGVTANLVRRVGQHREGAIAGFTERYHVTRLVYAEETSDVRAAIAREKQLKGWTRKRKVALIEAADPEWRDLLGTADSRKPDPSLRSG